MKFQTSLSPTDNLTTPSGGGIANPTQSNNNLTTPSRGQDAGKEIPPNTQGNFNGAEGYYDEWRRKYKFRLQFDRFVEIVIMEICNN